MPVHQHVERLRVPTRGRSHQLQIARLLQNRHSASPRASAKPSWLPVIVPRQGGLASRKSLKFYVSPLAREPRLSVPIQYEAHGLKNPAAGGTPAPFPHTPARRTAPTPAAPTDPPHRAER